MKTDGELKCHVDNELNFNPEIDSTDMATRANSDTAPLSRAERDQAYRTAASETRETGLGSPHYSLG
jgi:hypothetical protein